MIKFLQSKIRYLDYLIERERKKQNPMVRNYWGPLKQREIKGTQEFLSRWIKLDVPKQQVLDCHREYLSEKILKYEMNEDNTL